MNFRPKVSVIIPVYNAEEYLEECIKSLLNQTLKECAFIFINDGSNDSSKSIIEKYKDLDNRIILINQQNRGVSIARNEGIKNATGEYIGFVDADDYIESDMYETLYNCAIKNDCDLVLSNFEGELDGHKSISKYDFPKNKKLDKEYIQKHVISRFIESDDLNAIWNKIYKLSVINKHEIYFPEGLALGEDGIFNLRYFINASSYTYIEYAGYHYREVNGSATRSIFSKDYFARSLDVFNADISEIDKLNISKEKIKCMKSKKLINSVMSYCYIYLVPSSSLRIIDKLKYVKNMINDKSVREALICFKNNYYNDLDRYSKFMFNMIEKKFVLGIYGLVGYSWLRNKE